MKCAPSLYGAFTPCNAAERPLTRRSGGRSTLVTGTSTGIGFATALHFARHGHQVVATMRNLAKAGPLEEAARAEKLPLVVRELWGPIRMIQAVLPSMRERRSGCIVNVTSIAGRVATPNRIPYSASKHALAAASEALAHEVAAFGIHVAIDAEGLAAGRARISDEE
jgi:NAD(P)-dependent dehydrogenase (short-subunit alcohol dehydrogenase family)